METEFTPIASLIGGVLIGAASVWYMASIGRIAGIGGIVSRLLSFSVKGIGPGVAFLVGLLVAAPIYHLVSGSAPQVFSPSNVPLLLLGGLLVGFGSVVGSGCISGHGVIGLSRLSPRSIVATGMFMLTGFITVYVLRHVIGG
ncbi:MAG: YeeE/YedE thiosulfate transporter family protein [Rhizobiaceae bacterium]